MAFENFLGLFSFFLRSLIPKKSSGMQKPYVCLVIHEKPTQKFHSSSLCWHSFQTFDPKQCLSYQTHQHRLADFPGGVGEFNIDQNNVLFLML